ncbi:MAG: hypothetical protein E7451_10450 [Ruminococcaceae bacterium]|nr:hypothetical protein [Oscillospiraceae bacterium]
MKIKALSLLIAICLVVSLFPVTMAAQNNSGTWGDNLSWSYVNGTLTLTGKGEMALAEYDEDDLFRMYPWADLPATKLVIGEGITSLAANAFEFMPIETVSLPQSLEKMGEAVFSFCSELTGPVVIPEKVTRIPAECFEYCTSLEEVVLHDGITSLGWYCFGNSGLKRIYIPAGVTDLTENYSLDFCENLEKITVSKDNSYYASDAQGAMYSKDMTYLELVPRGFRGKFVIPEGVLYADGHPYGAGNSAFEGCEKITEIHVPTTLKQLFGHSLTSDALTGVYVAEGNPALYDVDGVLYGYMDENPETGNGKVLSLIKIPAKKAITDYTVAKDVLCVGSHAFEGCAALKNVTIHKDCEMFAEAFDYSGVEAIWIEDGHPEFRSDSEGVVFNQDMTVGGYDFELGDWVDTFYPAGTALMCFPKGRTGYYEIPEGTTYLGGGSFASASIEALRFPTSLTKIESYAFFESLDLRWMLFTGEKPAFDGWFDEVDELTVYYPGWLESWAEPEIFDAYYTYIPYEQGKEPVYSPFTDVPAGSFYAEPVAWAVENGITTGASANSFNPDGQCLRAHVVTFLWRAEGCPEPKSLSNPFVDVKESDFYFKAVLWAVENGITNGSDATHFNPFGVCNRAQVVTFLHRAKDSPAPASLELPFTDVPAGTWYATPIAWAVENGITNGLSATQFGPNTACNRAQVVTFLYRTYTNS